jgi:hypothetical protein
MVLIRKSLHANYERSEIFQQQWLSTLAISRAKTAGQT